MEGMTPSIFYEEEKNKPGEIHIVPDGFFKEMYFPNL